MNSKSEHFTRKAGRERRLECFFRQLRSLPFSAAAMLCVLLASGDCAFAAPAEEVHSILRGDLAGQVNPPGLMGSVGVGRQWVTGWDEKRDMPSSYLQAGFAAGSTPAYGRLSAHAEWLAAIFAKIRVQYDLYRFYGTNSSLLSFPSATAAFGQEEVDAMEGSEEPGSGSRFLVRPTLYAKIGPALIVNRTDFALFRISGQGPYFLEWTYETLLKERDRVWENRTNILFEPWSGRGKARLMAGPYVEITHADAADVTRRRAGIMAYWVPWDRKAPLGQPHFFAQAGRYERDRNREGEYMATIGAGFDLEW